MGSSERRASHAGSWYRAEKKALIRQLDAWFDAVQEPRPDGLRAVIGPHAGYDYCGHVLAHAYKHVDPSVVRRVFVLGPSHHFYTKRCLLSPATSFASPIGSIPVDVAVVTALRKSGLFDMLTPSEDEEEHSIEMHVPFLIRALQRNKNRQGAAAAAGGGLGWSSKRGSSESLSSPPRSPARDSSEGGAEGPAATRGGGEGSGDDEGRGPRGQRGPAGPRHLTPSPPRSSPSTFLPRALSQLSSLPGMQATAKAFQRNGTGGGGHGGGAGGGPGGERAARAADGGPARGASASSRERSRVAIVPILVGDLTYDSAAEYAALLAPHLADPSTLFAVSTDFCHWGSRFGFTKADPSLPIHESIRDLDAEGMRLFERGDPVAFELYLQRTGNTICGRHAMAVLMHALRQAYPAPGVSPRPHGADATATPSSAVSSRFVSYDQSSRVRRASESSVSYAAALVTLAA